MENKKNIFTRFINFIKRLFGNEELKQLPEKAEVITRYESNSDFSNKLKLYKEEDPTLLNLQNQYEKNEINLSAMSNEQIHNLSLLYNRQVSELKKKLNNQKTELSIIQHKIKSYSANT